MKTFLNKITITDEELAKINTYTRNELSVDEFYAFSFVLCDNDIDKNYECFPVTTLEGLRRMFVGKTGIIQHNLKGEKSTAKIYDCKIEAVESKKTDLGDDYFRLIAKAYIVKGSRTESSIYAIDNYNKTDTKIACSVSETRCAVCGKETINCNHIKGNTYDNKICVYTLHNVNDVYEWVLDVEITKEDEVKTMTKSDLKTGHIVTLRDGSKGIVIKDVNMNYEEQNIIIFPSNPNDEDNNKTFDDFSSYDENLKYSKNELNCWDIVKIEKCSNPYRFLEIDYNDSEVELLWERKEENPSEKDTKIKEINEAIDALCAIAEKLKGVLNE